MTLATARFWRLVCTNVRRPAPSPPPPACADGVEASHQERALSAGGFGAVGAMLALEGVAPPGLQGAVHRKVLLQALCVQAAAFHLSPWRLPGAVVGALVQLLADLLQGGARGGRGTIPQAC